MKWVKQILKIAVIEQDKDFHVIHVNEKPPNMFSSFLFQGSVC